MAALPLVAALALATPAAAAAEIRDISGEELAGLLRKAGYRATVGRDSGGDPMVTSSAAGAQFSIMMYDCQEDRCKSLQFGAGFDLADGGSLANVNAWNRDKRYAKAWLDDEVDPWLELDLDLEGGGSLELVGDYIELWDAALGQFQTHVHQQVDPASEADDDQA
jgi:hypothetical protein